MVQAAYFLSLILLALGLGAGLAHLYALPNKMRLSQESYLATQRAYDGWSMLGVVAIGTPLAILWLAVLLRTQGREFVLALLALACTVGAQVVFWIATWPANQATRNWTELPADWEAQRRAWEYSHAVGAALNLAAFVLLVLALLSGYGRQGGP